MAAHAHQDQRVLFRFNVLGLRKRVPHGERLLFFPASSRRAAPDFIGEPPAGYLCEPRSRILRNAIRRPLPRGGQQSFLHRIFRCREISVPPHQEPEHLRHKVAKQVLERRFHQLTSGGPLSTCLTSIGMFSGVPPCPGAADAFAAIS